MQTHTQRHTHSPATPPPHPPPQSLKQPHYQYHIHTTRSMIVVWNGGISCVSQDFYAAVVRTVWTSTITCGAGAIHGGSWEGAGLLVGGGSGWGGTGRGWGMGKEAQDFFDGHGQLLVLLHLQADSLRLLQHLLHRDGQADVIDVLENNTELLV